MRVAILSALNAELETLLATATDVDHTDIGSWTLWSGSIEDREVILARAGLGKVNTAALAGIIWERHRPETILFTGVAGGLDPIATPRSHSGPFSPETSFSRTSISETSSSWNWVPRR